MIDEKKLKSEIGSLQEGWIALLETNSEKMLEAAVASMKILTAKGYYGIILSANRPYSNLLSLYKNNSIDTRKILVLDCICRSQGMKLEKIDNVIFLEKVGDLTNISLSITEALGKTKGKRFLFIDSITTMLIHNNPNVFARFIHSILTKLRMQNISGLLVSLQKGANEEVRNEIMQLCDKVIRV